MCDWVVAWNGSMYPPLVDAVVADAYFVGFTVGTPRIGSNADD